MKKNKNTDEKRSIRKFCKRIVTEFSKTGDNHEKLGESFSSVISKVDQSIFPICSKNGTKPKIKENEILIQKGKQVIRKIPLGATDVIYVGTKGNDVFSILCPHDNGKYALVRDKIK